MVQSEISEKIQAGSVNIDGPTVPPLDYCFCKYSCEYVETVFATSLDETDPLYFYQGSQNDFLASIPDLSGSINFFLVNQSTGVETALTGTTYGVFFAFGTLDNPEAAGYRVDWTKVANLLGYGRYKVRIDTNSFGTAKSIESRQFKVIPYSVENTDGTVLIETVSNGIFEDGFDYRGLDWVGSLRVKGRFSMIDPIEEEEYYSNTSWKEKQIQERKIKRYQLELQDLNAEILNVLLTDRLMSNTIKITDYNFRDFEDLRQIEVVKSSFTTFEIPADSKTGYFVVEFESPSRGPKRN